MSRDDDDTAITAYLRERELREIAGAFRSLGPVTPPCHPSATAPGGSSITAGSPLATSA